MTLPRRRANHRSVSGAIRARRAVVPTKDENVLATNNVCERDVAESFACAVAHFDAAQLAKAAVRTKETARQWKEGIKAPNSASLINMARKIPAVDQWLKHQIGRYEEFDFESPQKLAAIVAAAIRELDK